MDPKAIQSYHLFMELHLLDKIDVLKENINIPKGTLTMDEIPLYCKGYEDKIDKLDVLEVFGAPVSEKPEHASSEASAESHFEDALSALINLGYNRSEAYTAVKKSLNNDIAKSELSTLIANALRELSANVR